MVATVGTTSYSNPLTDTGAPGLDGGVIDGCRVVGLVEALNAVSVVGLSEAALREVLGLTARLRGGLDALDFRVAAEADRLAAQGCSAPAEELLADGGRLRPHTALRQAARSRVVADVAGLSKAVGSGEVGGDHVDSLAQRLKKLSVEERSRIDDARLVDRAKRMPADRFDRAVKAEVDRVRSDHGLTDTLEKRRASEFNHWFDHKTGMGKFSGQLDPERYEALTTAVDQHVATLAASVGAQSSAERITKDSTLAAAALAELVCTSPERSRNVPHITIVVDYETLAGGGHDDTTCRTANGHGVPPETVARLACDSVLRKVVLDERQIPISVGRKYRTATDAQWAAISSVHSTCGWPGCDRPLSWCQLHHIKEWNDGGGTDLDNLVPLCSTHHHRVHEGKWTIQLKTANDVTTDRTLQIWKPNGQPLSARPDPPNRSGLAYKTQAPRL